MSAGNLVRLPYALKRTRADGSEPVPLSTCERDVINWAKAVYRAELPAQRKHRKRMLNLAVERLIADEARITARRHA